MTHRPECILVSLRLDQYSSGHKTACSIRENPQGVLRKGPLDTSMEESRCEETINNYLPESFKSPYTLLSFHSF